MLLCQLFSIAVVSAVAVKSQKTVVDIFATIPTCAAACYTNFLAPANCQTSDLRACFCTNTKLQLKVSSCILVTCNVTDLYVATIIRQTEICAGVPQESLRPKLFLRSVVLAAFSYPIIALRFVARAVLGQKFWWDDWTLLMAVVFMVCNSAIPIYMTTLGLGDHFYNVPLQNFVLLRKLSFSISVFYIAIQNLVKVSILLLYKRIFPVSQFHTVCLICIVWITAHATGFILASIFQCTPVAGYWNPSVAKKCLNLTTLAYVGAGFTIVEDLILIFLPLYELRILRSMDLKKRVALGFLFTLGCFATVTSIIRLKYIFSYGRSIDATYDNVDLFIWSGIEVYLAAICSCFICMYPFFLRVFHALPLKRNRRCVTGNVVHVEENRAKKNSARAHISEDEYPPTLVGSEQDSTTLSKGSQVEYELRSVRTEGRESL